MIPPSKLNPARKAGDTVYLVHAPGVRPTHGTLSKVISSTLYGPFFVGDKRIKFKSDANKSECGNYWVYESERAYDDARERSALEQIFAHKFAYPDPSISLDQLTAIADILNI